MNGVVYDVDFVRFASDDYDGAAVAAEYAADESRDLRDERRAWGFGPAAGLP